MTKDLNMIWKEHTGKDLTDEEAWKMVEVVKMLLENADKNLNEIKEEMITFCGQKCKVIERYTISEEFARENDLVYRNRIKFETPNGMIHDCADRF